MKKPKLPFVKYFANWQLRKRKILFKIKAKSFLVLFVFCFFIANFELIVKTLSSFLVQQELCLQSLSNVSVFLRRDFYLQLFTCSTNICSWPSEAIIKVLFEIIIVNLIFYWTVIFFGVHIISSHFLVNIWKALLYEQSVHFAYAQL